MTNDDIDEFLKEGCIDFDLCNDKLINLQMDKPTYLTNSLKTKKNIAYMLRYQGKFYFVMGRYTEALEYLTKLLEFEPSDPFALRYQAEIYHIMERYEESLMGLDK